MDSSEYGVITDDEGTVVELGRSARRLSDIEHEWLIWLSGVMMVLMNGLMWIPFPPPHSVSMAATVPASILLGLLLLPMMRTFGSHQEVLNRKIQLHMRKEIAKGICPVCGSDLRGQELIDAERLRCPACGSVWEVGKARQVGRDKSAAEVCWFILERLATVIAVVCFVLISLRVADLFLTVYSVIFVCGVALIITLALKFWHRHCVRSAVK